MRIRLPLRRPCRKPQVPGLSVILAADQYDLLIFSLTDDEQALISGNTTQFTARLVNDRVTLPAKGFKTSDGTTCFNGNYVVHQHPE